LIKSKLSSKFIVLDGPDGCGKTTQIDMLAKYLENLGVDVVKTNDPGGTKIGDQISRLLKYDAQGQMDVHTELMLFMASRAQLVTEIIKPSLESNKTILCDRFVSSTCAYQGSSGYPVNKIIELGKLAIDNIWPNLTIIIDISAEEGLLRTGRKPYQKTKVNHEDAEQHYLFKNVVVDRFDSRPLEYHRKVRNEFLKLPDYYPTPVKIVDGSKGGIESVHEKIKEVVTQTLNI
jgi:dTMP kinase